MTRELQGTVALSAGDLETVTAETGSFEMGASVAVRVTVTPIVTPTHGFDLYVQLEQTLDNLSFVDVGDKLHVSSASPGHQEVSHVAGAFVRARLEFTVVEAATGVFAISIEPAPNPKAPRPELVIPGFSGTGEADLALRFSWAFAVAAHRGRVMGIRPAMPGLAGPDGNGSAGKGEVKSLGIEGAKAAGPAIPGET